MPKVPQGNLRSRSITVCLSVAATMYITIFIFTLCKFKINIRHKPCCELVLQWIFNAQCKVLFTILGNSHVELSDLKRIFKYLFCSLNHLSNQFDTLSCFIFKGSQSSSIDPHYWHIFDKLPGWLNSFCGQCPFYFFSICIYISDVCGMLESNSATKGCIPFCLVRSVSLVAFFTLLSSSLSLSLSLLSVWQSRSTAYGFYLFVLLSMRTLVKCKPLSPRRLQLGLLFTAYYHKTLSSVWRAFLTVLAPLWRFSATLSGLNYVYNKCTHETHNRQRSSLCSSTSSSLCLVNCSWRHLTELCFTLCLTVPHYASLCLTVPPCASLCLCRMALLGSV